MAKSRERAALRRIVTPAALALCAAVGTAASAEVRPIDGVGNNIANPQWGAFNAALLRMTPNAYADGFQALAGPNRENPRVISNTVVHQDTIGGNIIPDPRGMTDFGWGWGQVMDHDIGLTPTDGPGTAFIQIPSGDPWYDPDNTGGGLLPFRRSRIVPGTGTGPGNPREQVNVDTSYIDASFVYGSDVDRAAWLRTFQGGRLKSQIDPVVGEMPPYNDGTQTNAGGNDVTLLVAGDERINETTSLACFHTLFVREHNRLADEIAAANPKWTDEEIYQRARALVIAQVQKIHFEDFLPSLFGEANIPPYQGYDPNVNPTMATEFSSAAYRVGHTMLSPIILRLDENGDVIPHGNLALRNTFFNPDRIFLEGGLEPIFRGLAAGQMQKIDGYINDEIRIFLFNDIGSTPPAMDLISLNIQRAREHGLEDYNAIRQAYGLARKNSFAEITSDPVLQARLAMVYDDMDDIDPWVGMVCEDHYPGSGAGETITTIVVDQFMRCRDGDRFWYEINPQLSPEDVAWVKQQKLSDIIIRNTNIQPGEIQPNVFFVSCPGDLDSNLVINGSDLGNLLAAWNSSDSPADLNGDGVVNGADLASLLANWGSCID